MNDWNPQHYLAFADERTRPAADLLARIRHLQVQHVVDLGCGPGNSTALLVRTWPQAKITGVDSSATMIAQARKTLPDIDFVQEDFTQWQGVEPQDLIFANASLQWADRHDTLLPRLVDGLKNGGVLAVQMPDNLDEPSHRLMRETAAEPQWRVVLDSVPVRPPMPESGAYYDILSRAGCRVEIWRTAYYHVLPDVHSIVQWFGSTALRPYLDALDESGKAAFSAAYVNKLRRAYPPCADGNILLVLPRLFIVAQKTGAPV